MNDLMFLLLISRLSWDGSFQGLWVALIHFPSSMITLLGPGTSTQILRSTRMTTGGDNLMDKRKPVLQLGDIFFRKDHGHVKPGRFLVAMNTYASYIKNHA